MKDTPQNSLEPHGGPPARSFHPRQYKYRLPTASPRYVEIHNKYGRARSSHPRQYKYWPATPSSRFVETHNKYWCATASSRCVETHNIEIWLASAAISLGVVCTPNIHMSSMVDCECDCGTKRNSCPKKTKMKHRNKNTTSQTEGSKRIDLLSHHRYF